MDNLKSWCLNNPLIVIAYTEYFLASDLYRHNTIYFKDVWAGTDTEVRIVVAQEANDPLFPDHHFSFSIDKRLLSDEWEKHAPGSVITIVKQREEAIKQRLEKEKQRRFNLYLELKKEFEPC